VLDLDLKKEIRSSPLHCIRILLELRFNFVASTATYRGAPTIVFTTLGSATASFSHLTSTLLLHLPRRAPTVRRTPCNHFTPTQRTPPLTLFSLYIFQHFVSPTLGGVFLLKSQAAFLRLQRI